LWRASLASFFASLASFFACLASLFARLASFFACMLAFASMLANQPSLPYLLAGTVALWQIENSEFGYGLSCQCVQARQYIKKD